MMLAMLMLNAILGDVTDDVMLRHFRSQTILVRVRARVRFITRMGLTLILTQTLTLTRPPTARAPPSSSASTVAPRRG